MADETAGPGSDAAIRLSRDLNKLASGDVTVRQKAEATFVKPLLLDLRELRESLHPEVVTRADLPAALVREWTTPDGRLRVEVTPKGNANNSATLIRFSRAVLSVRSDATGPAIEAYEWGSTILTAFAQAGASAIGAIALLLWLALRRIGDVLLTLIPLLVAATATLEICALSGFALNYANIIALPALLGIGSRLQNLLCDGMARGRNQLPAVESDAGRVFQRCDDRHRIWQSLLLQPTGHLQHGEAVGIIASVHSGFGCAISAGADGTAAGDQAATSAQLTRFEFSNKIKADARLCPEFAPQAKGSVIG